MFSHTIHNPNNLVITKDNFHVIPFGYRCSSALACKYAGLRNFSLPFDWTAESFPNTIQKTLENDFANYIPDVHNNIFTNIYNIKLAHFNPNIDDGVKEYTRRINRFVDILQSPKKKYFVYINENYFHCPKYREKKFNEKHFDEMISLDVFLKKKYANIDYVIMYFDFKQHTIPKDSNIMNIVLHSATMYENESESPFNTFRQYCGKILTELFSTTLDMTFGEGDFYN